MADIQFIGSKSHQKTFENRRNIVLYKVIGIKKSNANVKIFTGRS